MAYLDIESWERLLEIASFCICVITFLYLMAQKIRNNNHSAGKKNRMKKRGFEEEVLIQLLRQQAEKAFEAISRTIEKERRVLLECMEKKASKEKGISIPAGETDQTRAPSLKREEGSQNVGDSTKDPHARVSQMAEMGLDAKEISRQVEMPKGEIELIMKLRNRQKLDRRQKLPTGRIDLFAN